jgi:hypothetical protein
MLRERRAQLRVAQCEGGQGGKRGKKEAIKRQERGNKEARERQERGKREARERQDSGKREAIERQERGERDAREMLTVERRPVRRPPGRWAWREALKRAAVTIEIATCLIHA